jgi:hypothetical protein
MDILITEEQYKVILKENLIKDTLKDLKINSKILFTFGTGMGAFIGPVTRYLAGSGFSLNGNEIALLIITSVALLINDTNKKELLDEVENLNLGSALESTMKLLETCLNIIKSLVKKIMGVSYSLSEILGFAFLLVPVMNVLNLIISDRNITSTNVEDLFKGVILSSLSFLIKNIFAKFKGKPIEEMFSINEEIEPSERAVKNICDSKKFCSAQGKITFGQLRELVESAKTRRLYLHMGEGGYKATLRLLPWFLPQLAIAGFTGSLLRAFHKIIKPTLEETNNYKTWWGRTIMKIFNLVEGELNVKDPLSKIFFISDGLLTMLDDKEKIKFARYISSIASEKPDNEEVPEYFVENELRHWLNDKFLLDPPLQPKNVSNNIKDDEEINGGITEGITPSMLLENFVRLSEKEVEQLHDAIREMGIENDQVEYELDNLINYYDNLPDKLILYRIVFSDSINEIDTQYPGSHYSMNKRNLVNSHYGPLRDSSYGEKSFLIKVKAQKQMIDFFESIKNNILYPNEEEVTLKNKGFGVEVVDITPIQ